MTQHVDRDMAILGRLIRLVTNKCRFCACQGDSCSIGGGEKCCWVGDAVPEKTLCNNPACLRKMEIQKEKLKRVKTRRVRIVKGRVA